MRILVVIALLFTNFLVSQNQFNTKDLTTTRTDLELNKFKQDTTANALVLYEYGNAKIDEKSFNLVLNYKKKIKILNRNGFDQADVKIYLYNSGGNKEKITNLIATTTNIEDGKVNRINLDASQIFEEKADENHTIFKFILPNIKEGSVITYSYTFESPFIYKFNTWRFQEEIPKLYSEYNTSIPGNYDYNIKLVGELKLDANESTIKKSCIERNNGARADCTVGKYTMKDIPAFIEEDYMTSAKNYLSRIEYELKVVKGFDGTVNNITKNWETTDKELRTDSNFGKQLKKESLIKKLIDPELLNQKSELEKANYIFDFVKSNYNWNNYYRIFKDVSIKEVIEEKSGNVAEINLLLYNLLKKHGIQIYPVLLSTRDNGFITKLYPVISEFNYIILRAEINGESYFLDATDPSLIFGEIPFRCLNQYGREIDFKNGSRWVNINPKTNSSIQQKVIVKINDDGTFTGTLTTSKTGYNALKARQTYTRNNQDNLKQYNSKYPDYTFEDIEVEINKNSKSVFTETLSISGPLTTIGNKVYLDPFIFKIFTENPLKLNKRTYPIDFGYKNNFVYNIKIETSDNYKIIETPEEKSFKLSDNSGLLVFKHAHLDNIIELSFRVHFYNTIYSANYYSELKSFYNELVKIQNNIVIVLEKNN
ncbi:DUF3857 domain-containing protein [Psychroserpens sp. NJDZ02]|uniref:DUF3857 domain-containing protein n=1 Tax=Psychroserpens sp. NJDZ02 TaxID=2570561 RepID=UPI0010A8DE42|nr:DUF3857 domain-containing protein [Psychroserpens sp. NJDZ02]QCE43402.1 DUF3857 domain-containing protein [Psychroserpens sp. NJDZ02]